MPDLKSKDIPASKLVEECERLGSEYMSERYAIWSETQDAYNAKGPITSSEGLNVSLNHVLPIIEQNVPRDIAALLPTRPYIGIESIRRDQKDIVRWKEQVVDLQLDRAKFHHETTQAMIWGEGYGNAYMFTGWDSWIETMNDVSVKVDPLTGIQTIDRAPTKMLKDGLYLKADPPWSWVHHPVGDTLDEKPWSIRKGVATIDDVERKLDTKAWRLPKGVTIKDIKKSPMEQSAQPWMSRWRRDLQGLAGGLRDEMVVVLELFSAGRWITVLNYQHEVIDSEPRWTNMDRRKKPCARLCVNPHLGSNRFWGKGIWERIRDKALLRNDFYSLYLDSAIMSRARWFMYDPTYIDKEQLSATWGGTIRIKNGNMLQDTDRALKIIDVPEPPRTMMEIADALGGEIDNITHRRDVTSGIGSSPKQTKGEVEILNQNASIPLGFTAKWVEQTFMLELAELIPKLCAENMTPIQMVDEGGLTYEQAMMIGTPDPSDVPGGIQWVFDGSDRATRRNEKHEKMVESFNLTFNTQVVQQNIQLQNAMVKKLLEDSERFDDMELDALMPEQPMGMMPQGGPGPAGGVEAVGAAPEPTSMGQVEQQANVEAVAA